MEPMFSSNTISDENRRVLLDLARKSIQFGLEKNTSPLSSSDAYPKQLKSTLATFVTLTLRGQLRGCIGTLEAYRPLVDDIADNAAKAAFSDPRFEPVTALEIEHLDIHISILSPPQEIQFDSETELLAQLQPSVDGLIIQDDTHKGTFLPSVWESLPDPEDFLQHLKQKAGFRPDYWSDKIRVFRYYAVIIE